MRPLERRLRALEQRRGAHRYVVLVADAESHWTEEEALEAVGVEPADHDLVVFLLRFMPTTGRPRFSMVSHEAIQTPH